MRSGNLLERIRNRRILALDIARWRWRARQLPRPPHTPHGILLLADLMLTTGGFKFELLLAALLRRGGYDFVVLLPTVAWYHRAYVRALGGGIVAYEDFITAEDRRNAAATAERMLAEARDIADLFDVCVGGCRVGRNALSWALRTLRTGSLDLQDKAHREAMRTALETSLIAVAACGRVLETLRPDKALFNERGYSPAGELFDLCVTRGVDVVQWLGAPKSETLLFKRYDAGNRALHPLALGDETWAALKTAPPPLDYEREVVGLLAANYASGAWFNRQKLQEGKAIFDREDTRRRLGVAPGRRVAVIFSHILYDATFFYGKSLYRDYETWLVETVRGAIANPALDWIVKVHPVNVWRSKSDGKPMEQLEAIALRKAFGKLPPHVRIMPADTDINTFSLFDAIDYGLTVRGTIGMELPCFGIPTVTAGTGRYSCRGFTVDSDTVADYQKVIATLHDREPLDAETVRLARLYAYGTFFMRPQPLTTARIDFAAPSSVVWPPLRFDRRGDWSDLARVTDFMLGEAEDLMTEPSAATTGASA